MLVVVVGGGGGYKVYVLESSITTTLKYRGSQISGEWVQVLHIVLAMRILYSVCINYTRKVYNSALHVHYTFKEDLPDVTAS